jgi:hypothetical protein
MAWTGTTLPLPLSCSVHKNCFRCSYRLHAVLVLTYCRSFNDASANADATGLSLLKKFEGDSSGFLNFAKNVFAGTVPLVTSRSNHPMHRQMCDF